MKHTNVAVATAVALAIGSASELRAQANTSYPDRQITMIVPFAAGGPSDVVARIVAESMARTLNQSIVIENVGGAGGTTGSARVAAAKPDGYTLLSGSMGSHVAAPTLYTNLKYDSRKDFEPVGLVMHGPAVVVARKDMPATNLKEFIAYLRANSGKVSQGHGGVGASSHMACLLFNTEAGVNANVVAYRGSGPALNDVVAGQIDYVCDSTMGMAEQIKAGNVKAFAITSPERSPALPMVPTSKEGGLPRYDLSIWSAIFAPKGTPAPIIAILNGAVEKALEEKVVIERIQVLGGNVVSRKERPPKYLADLVSRETARWEPILKSAVAATGAEQKK